MLARDDSRIPGREMVDGEALFSLDPRGVGGIIARNFSPPWGVRGSSSRQLAARGTTGTETKEVIMRSERNFYGFDFFDQNVPVI